MFQFLVVAGLLTASAFPRPEILAEPHTDRPPLPRYRAWGADAATAWNGSSVTFFRNDQVATYQVKAANMGAPVAINVFARNWPSGWSSVDAACSFDARRVYLFKGSQYARFDPGTGAVAAGYPKAIAGNFASDWPKGWDHVDAAVNLGNGHIYFFRGKDYIKYRIDGGRVTGPPKPIAGNFAQGWPAWPSVDAAVNYGNGNVYFFRGDEYFRYKIKGATCSKPAKAIGNFLNRFEWTRPKVVASAPRKPKLASPDGSREPGFRVLINGIQCLQTGDGGNSQDEPYVEVYVDGNYLGKLGPRSMNEADESWQKDFNEVVRQSFGKGFAKAVAAAKEEFWLMPGCYYARSRVEFKLWEADSGGRGKSILEDNDDYIGSIVITADDKDGNGIAKELQEGSGRWRIVCTKLTRRAVDRSIVGACRQIPVRVPVLNQGPEGACVAHAVVGALTTEYLNATEPGGGRKDLFDAMALHRERRDPNPAWRTDAATAWNDDNAYFFQDTLYARYEVSRGSMGDDYPKKIEGKFASGWPGQWDKVDAACSFDEDRVYVFRGKDYIRYNPNSGKVATGYPKEIDGNFATNWPPGWDHVDAAVNLGNGHIYFFRGKDYIKYRIDGGRVTGPPKPIAGNFAQGWPAWPSVDAAVNYGNGNVYFFRGDEYFRYKIKGATCSKPAKALRNFVNVFGWDYSPGWNLPDALKHVMMRGIPFKESPSKRLFITSYLSYAANGTVKRTVKDGDTTRTTLAQSGGDGHDKMRKALNEGRPLLASYAVYPDFLAYAGEQGVYGGRVSAATTTGNHAVFVIGYRNPGIGENAFPTWTLQNSWGGEFGRNGLATFAAGSVGFDDEMFAIEKWEVR